MAGAGTAMLAFVMVCQGTSSFTGKFWAGGNEGWRAYESRTISDSRSFYVDMQRAIWCEGTSPCQGGMPILARAGDMLVLKEIPRGQTQASGVPKGRAYVLLIAQDGSRYESFQTQNTRDEKTAVHVKGTCRVKPG